MPLILILQMATFIASFVLKLLSGVKGIGASYNAALDVVHARAIPHSQVETPSNYPATAL